MKPLLNCLKSTTQSTTTTVSIRHQILIIQFDRKGGTTYPFTAKLSKPTLNHHRVPSSQMSSIFSAHQLTICLLPPIDWAYKTARQVCCSTFHMCFTNFHTIFAAKPPSPFQLAVFTIVFLNGRSFLEKDCPIRFIDTWFDHFFFNVGWPIRIALNQN